METLTGDTTPGGHTLHFYILDWSIYNYTYIYSIIHV